MNSRVPYDDFAEIYDAWVESVPFSGELRRFYVDLLDAADDPVVELGVGNGRIAIEIARRGRRVIGVDSSTAILDLCRRRAAAAGVDDRLELLQADFRDFELPEPAGAIAIPFHSLGHLESDDGKRRCMERVRSQLRPGGLFVWDHFVFDPDYPIPPGIPNLRAEIPDPATGRRRLVWETSTRDLERRLITVHVRVEELDERGAVEHSRYIRTTMSWIDPERSRELLEATGFEIEALYGGFDRAPFGPSSSHQVWLARPV